VFFAAHTEVVDTKEVELKLDLIRVVCDPNPLFKYQLIYRDGMATGMVGVYCFDEDWYYLYKSDTERYRVKRCKDLEGIPPAFTYKQQRGRREDKPDKQKPLEKSAVADSPEIEEVADQSYSLRMGGM
jgi:stage V sporulation protein G